METCNVEFQKWNNEHLHGRSKFRISGSSTNSVFKRKALHAKELFTISNTVEAKPCMARDLLLSCIRQNCFAVENNQNETQPQNLERASPYHYPAMPCMARKKLVLKRVAIL